MSELKMSKEANDWKMFYMEGWRSLASKDDVRILSNYLLHYLSEDDLVMIRQKVDQMLQVKHDH